MKRDDLRGTNSRIPVAVLGPFILLSWTISMERAAFAADDGEVGAAVAWARQELAHPVARTPGMKGEEAVRYQEQQRISRSLGSCERGSQVSCAGLVRIHKEAVALEDARLSVSEASLAQRAKTACPGSSAEPECIVLTHLSKVCAAGDQPTCDRLNALRASPSAAGATAGKPETPLERWRRIQEERYKQAAPSTEQGRQAAAPTPAEPSGAAAAQAQGTRSTAEAAPGVDQEPPAPAEAEPIPAEDTPPAPAEDAEDPVRIAALAWARQYAATPMAKPVVDPANIQAYQREYRKWYLQQELVEYLQRCDEGSVTGCSVVTKLYQDAVAAGEVPES